MQGTIWKKLLRRCLSDVHREIKITFTPVPKPKKWVFIVGCYNSGTTLLSEVLASHHLIGSLPTEGHFLTDQLPSEYDLGISRMWMMREDLFRLSEEDDGPDVVRLKKEWGMRMNDRSKPILLEKSPQNGARCRWLQEHFEDAYFIGVVRNGYAVAEGISRKANPECQIGNWSVRTCARQWRTSNEVLKNDAEHLKRFMWTRYEDFTEDPGREINRILSFLDLDKEDGINVEKNWIIHERSEKIRNMNEESILKLSPADIQAVNQEAGACLKDFEYTVLQES